MVAKIVCTERNKNIKNKNIIQQIFCQIMYKIYFKIFEGLILKMCKEDK